MTQKTRFLSFVILITLMAVGVQQVFASSQSSAGDGVMPAQAATAAPTVNQEVIWVVTTTPRPDGSVVHVVQQGQAAWSIASAYGITVGQLAQLNSLDATNPAIFPGQELIVSGPVTPEPTATSEVVEVAATATPDLPPTATVDVAQMAAAVTVPAVTEMSEGQKIQADPQRLVGYGLILLCVVGLGALFVSAFARR